VCGERVRRLGTKAADLRSRRVEIEYEILDTEAPRITRKELERVRRGIAEAIETGAPETKKALLQALVAEVRVEGRKMVRPLFRVPVTPDSADALDQHGKVRTPSGSVRPAGLEPATDGLEVRCSIQLSYER
jgi:hypothetical protein